MLMTSYLEHDPSDLDLWWVTEGLHVFHNDGDMWDNGIPSTPAVCGTLNALRLLPRQLNYWPYPWLHRPVYEDVVNMAHRARFPGAET